MSKRIAFTQLDNGLEVSTVRLNGGRRPVYETMTFNGKSNRGIDKMTTRSGDLTGARNDHITIVSQAIWHKRCQ